MDTFLINHPAIGITCIEESCWHWSQRFGIVSGIKTIWARLYIIVCWAPSPESTTSGDYWSSAAGGSAQGPSSRLTIARQPYFFIESSVWVSVETSTDGPLLWAYRAVLLSVGTRMPSFLLRRFCLASLSGKSEGFPDNLRFHSTLSVKPYGYPDGSAWEGCPIGSGMTENIRGMLSVLRNREWRPCQTRKLPNMPLSKMLERSFQSPL